MNRRENLRRDQANGGRARSGSFASTNTANNQNDNNMNNMSGNSTGSQSAPLGTDFRDSSPNTAQQNNPNNRRTRGSEHFGTGAASPTSPLTLPVSPANADGAGNGGRGEQEPRFNMVVTDTGNGTTNSRNDSLNNSENYDDALSSPSSAQENNNNVANINSANDNVNSNRLNNSTAKNSRTRTSSSGRNAENSALVRTHTSNTAGSSNSENGANAALNNSNNLNNVNQNNYDNDTFYEAVSPKDPLDNYSEMLLNRAVRVNSKDSSKGAESGTNKKSVHLAGRSSAPSRPTTKITNGSENNNSSISTRISKNPTSQRQVSQFFHEQPKRPDYFTQPQAWFRHYATVTNRVSKNCRSTLVGARTLGATASPVGGYVGKQGEVYELTLDGAAKGIYETFLATAMTNLNNSLISSGNPYASQTAHEFAERCQYAIKKLLKERWHWWPMTEREALSGGQLRKHERVCVLGTPDTCSVKVPRNHEAKVVGRTNMKTVLCQESGIMPPFIPNGSSLPNNLPTNSSSNSREKKKKVSGSTSTPKEINNGGGENSNKNRTSEKSSDRKSSPRSSMQNIAIAEGKVHDFNTDFKTLSSGTNCYALDGFDENSGKNFENNCFDEEDHSKLTTTWYTLELVGLTSHDPKNPNKQQSNPVISLPEHLLHSVLPTSYLFHAPPSEYDDDCLRVRGAKGAGVFCNGNYGCMPVRFHLNYPVYKNAFGAIIYWSGFWKMNAVDDTSAWYYAFEVFLPEQTEPPVGPWTAYQYHGAAKGVTKSMPFLIRGNGFPPFPKPKGVFKKGELVVLTPTAAQKLKNYRNQLLTNYALRSAQIQSQLPISSVPQGSPRSNYLNQQQQNRNSGTLNNNGTDNSNEFIHDAKKKLRKSIPNSKVIEDLNKTISKHSNSSEGNSSSIIPPESSPHSTKLQNSISNPHSMLSALAGRQSSPATVNGLDAMSPRQRNEVFNAKEMSVVSETQVGEVVNVHEGPRPILVRSLKTGLIDFFAFPDLRRAECLESEESILRLENYQETFIAWVRKTFARHCVSLEEYTTLTRMLGDDYDVMSGVENMEGCKNNRKSKIEEVENNSSKIESGNSASSSANKPNFPLKPQTAGIYNVIDQTTSEFERFCMEETINEVNRIRVRFGWPRKEQKPRPPDGVPTIEIRRPDHDTNPDDVDDLDEDSQRDSHGEQIISPKTNKRRTTYSGNASANMHSPHDDSNSNVLLANNRKSNHMLLTPKTKKSENGSNARSTLTNNNGANNSQLLGVQQHAPKDSDEEMSNRSNGANSRNSTDKRNLDTNDNLVPARGTYNSNNLRFRSPTMENLETGESNIFDKERDLELSEMRRSKKISSVILARVASGENMNMNSTNSSSVLAAAASSNGKLTNLSNSQIATNTSMNALGGGLDLRLFLQSFSLLGTKSGLWWRRGFKIKYMQDEGVDWGALTKGWADYLVNDIMNVEAGLFNPQLDAPGENTNSGKAENRPSLSNAELNKSYSSQAAPSINGNYRPNNDGKRKTNEGNSMNMQGNSKNQNNQLAVPQQQSNTSVSSAFSLKPLFLMPDWASHLLGRDMGETRVFFEFTGKFLAYCLYMFVRLDMDLVRYLYKVLLLPPPVENIFDLSRKSIEELFVDDDEESRKSAKTGAVMTLSPCPEDKVKPNVSSSGNLNNGNGTDNRKVSLSKDEISDVASQIASSDPYFKYLLLFAGGKEVDCEYGGSSSSTSAPKSENENTRKSRKKRIPVLPAYILNSIDDKYLYGPKWGSAQEAIYDLQLVDPEKAKALQIILDWDEQKEGISLEHALCLDFTVEYSGDFLGGSDCFSNNISGKNYFNESKFEEACKDYLKESLFSRFDVNSNETNNEEGNNRRNSKSSIGSGNNFDQTVRGEENGMLFGNSHMDMDGFKKSVTQILDQNTYAGNGIIPNSPDCCQNGNNAIAESSPSSNCISSLKFWKCKKNSKDKDRRQSVTMGAPNNISTNNMNNVGYSNPNNRRDTHIISNQNNLELSQRRRSSRRSAGGRNSAGSMNGFSLFQGNSDKNKTPETNNFDLNAYISDTGKQCFLTEYVVQTACNKYGIKYLPPKSKNTENPLNSTSKNMPPSPNTKSSPKEQKKQKQPFLFLLKKNGDDIDVTQDNREEYILLLCKWLLKTSVLFSLSAFCSGFHSVLDSSQSTLRFLSPKLLDHMLCGTKEVTDLDLIDLRNSVRITNHEKLPQRNELLSWFFEIVKELSPPLRKELLNFWTGTTRVPSGGFANLSPEVTISLQGADKAESLPVSHVCFHRLDLPAYFILLDLSENLYLSVFYMFFLRLSFSMKNS